MEEKRLPGRPSTWDKKLGNGINKCPRYPIPVWEILEDKNTKKLLNKMALDENIKQKAWELGQ